MTEDKAITEQLQDILDDEDFKRMEIEDKNKLLHMMLGDNGTYYDELGEYTSSGYYREKHGARKKKDKRSDEDMFCNRLSIIGTHSLKGYDSWDYAKHKEYTLDRNNQPNNMMSISNAFSESLDNVKNDILYIDMIDDYTGNDDNYNLSEDDKRQKRKEDIHNNIYEYDDLNAAYQDYKKMGIKYGFDKDDYNKEERKQIQSDWIDKFNEDASIPNAESHLSKINKMYNGVGYELSVMLWEHQNLVEPNKKNQVKVDVDYDAVIEQNLNLSNHEHVAAMLSIKRDINMARTVKKSYHPLYVDLKNKYHDKIESNTYYMLLDFERAITHTEFDNIHKEIINLIFDNYKDYSIYDASLCEDILKANGNEQLLEQKAQVNPHELIKQYLDYEYGYKRSRADLIRIIENEISKLIANTYAALNDGIGFKKCTSCDSPKLAITDNYGKDKRNNDGLKSVCKKCDRQNRKRLSS